MSLLAYHQVCTLLCLIPGLIPIGIGLSEAERQAMEAALEVLAAALTSLYELLARNSEL